MSLILPQRGRIAQDAGSASGYSFNMTAGSAGGGLAIGYYPVLSIGSIDQEPIPGETLVVTSDAKAALGYPRDVFIMGWESNLETLLSGLKVYIDGTIFDPTGNCSFQWDGTTTDYKESGGADPVAYGFVNTNSYFIEIK